MTAPAADPDIDLLGAALTYAGAGWPVFPCHTPHRGKCSCGKRDCGSVGKHPRTAHGLKDATTNPAKVREFWRQWPDANIGIVTGETSGLDVLDVDPKNGGMESLGQMQTDHGPLPDTYTTRTPSGGQHRLYRRNGRRIRNSAGEIAPGIDTRGDGGYIVAPPSLGATGLRYEWTTPEGAELADPPVWLFASVVKDKPREGSGSATSDGPIAQGGRNNALASLAGAMRRPGMSPAAIEAALLEENRRRCVPPLPDDEVRKIAASVARYEPVPASAKPVRVSATPSGPERPRIIVSNRQLREVTAEALEALEAANTPPALFVRDGVPVRLRVDERGRPVIQGVTDAMLRNRLSACADFISVRKTKDGPVEISVAPPVDVVRAVLALDRFPFPALEAIVEVPILRADGTLVSQPGYDKATQVIYAPALGLDVPEIPEQPTGTQVADALSLLDEAIGEFPYANEESRANAFGLLLTTTTRVAIDGPVPLALVDAPQAGTGKSLLSSVAAIVATGRDAAVISPPDSDEELKKFITAELADGGTFFAFDNLDRPLWAPSLARALTAVVWKDRILGRSENAAFPIRATWLVTGNNVRLRGDLPRRCYRIRLDAKMARPWERAGFRHPDLLSWAKVNRGRLIGALLTLARAWWAATKPAAASPVIGSFEDWSRIVGGILQHAGVSGFLGNLAELYDEADEEAGQWEAFLEALARHFATGQATVAEIVERLTDGTDLRTFLPDDLADFDPFGEPTKKSGFQRRLGKALAKRAGTRYGNRGLHLERAGERHKVIVWRLAYDEMPKTDEVDEAGGGFTGLGGFIFPDVREKTEDSSICVGEETNPRNPLTPRPDQVVCLAPTPCSTCGEFDCSEHEEERI